MLLTGPYATPAPPTSLGFVSFLRKRRSFKKRPKNARARTPSGTPTPAPTAVTVFAKAILSASGMTEHAVLSEEATQSGVVTAGSEVVAAGSAGSDDVGVEDGKDDVGAEVSADDSTVVEDLGMIFTATPGLTLKSLPSSALHVFSVGLPHQNIFGLSAPSPSLHG